MTILNWVAGFQARTGWRFLSCEESADLSDAMRPPDGVRLRAIARQAQGGRLACLDAGERDPRKARVLILRHAHKRQARVEEEHPSLTAWIHALGLIRNGGAPGVHDGG